LLGSANGKKNSNETKVRDTESTGEAKLKELSENDFVVGEIEGRNGDWKRKTTRSEYPLLLTGGA